MSESKNVKIVFDATLVYAQVHRPNDYGMFSLEAVPANSEEEAKLTSNRVPERTKFSDGLTSELGRLGLAGKKVYTAQRKTITKAGVKMENPNVVDANGTPITVSLGNGTKARIFASASTYMGRNGLTTKLYFDTVQVIDLVRYEKTDKSSAVKVAPISGGFVASDEDTKPLIDKEVM